MMRKRVMKSIFKMPGGDVRWGWKAAILIVGTLLFGIVLNGVLTIVLVAVYSSQGLAPDLAMEQASNASTGFTAQVVLSLLQLGFMVWLVWRLVEKVAKQKFEWSGLGLINRTRSKQISFGNEISMILKTPIPFISFTAKYLILVILMSACVSVVTPEKQTAPITPTPEIFIGLAPSPTPPDSSLP